MHATKFKLLCFPSCRQPVSRCSSTRITRHAACMEMQMTATGGCTVPVRVASRHYTYMACPLLRIVLSTADRCFPTAGPNAAADDVCYSRLLDATACAPLIDMAVEAARPKDPDAGRLFGRGMRRVNSAPDVAALPPQRPPKQRGPSNTAAASRERPAPVPGGRLGVAGGMQGRPGAVAGSTGLPPGLPAPPPHAQADKQQQQQQQQQSVDHADSDGSGGGGGGGTATLQDAGRVSSPTSPPGRALGSGRAASEPPLDSPTTLRLHSTPHGPHTVRQPPRAVTLLSLADDAAVAERTATTTTAITQAVAAGGQGGASSAAVAVAAAQTEAPKLAAMQEQAVSAAAVAAAAAPAAAVGPARAREVQLAVENDEAQAASQSPANHCALIAAVPDGSLPNTTPAAAAATAAAALASIGAAEGALAAAIRPAGSETAALAGDLGAHPALKAPRAANTAAAAQEDNAKTAAAVKAPIDTPAAADGSIAGKRAAGAKASSAGDGACGSSLPAKHMGGGDGSSLGLGWASRQPGGPASIGGGSLGAIDCAPELALAATAGGRVNPLPQAHAPQAPHATAGPTAAAAAAGTDAVGSTGPAAQAPVQPGGGGVSQPSLVGATLQVGAAGG